MIRLFVLEVVFTAASCTEMFLPEVPCIRLDSTEKAQNPHDATILSDWNAWEVISPVDWFT